MLVRARKLWSDVRVSGRCGQTLLLGGEEALLSVFFARVPASITIVHVRVHIPKPELSKVFSVEVGPVERESGKIGSCDAWLHLLHLIVIEIVLV